MDEERFPTVSTHSLMLTLSCSLKPDFIKVMDMEILGSKAFDCQYLIVWNDPKNDIQTLACP